MIEDTLWQAKVAAIRGFASGPVALVPDFTERAGFFAELMVLIEQEHEDHFGPKASITDIRSTPPARELHPARRESEVRSSTVVRIDWQAAVDGLRRGGKDYVAHYTNHRTAVATVTKLRSRFPDIDIWTERDERGDGGSVVLRAR